MRKITEIIIHCSATPERRDFSAADIDLWHRQAGYGKIGYHYVIRLDGTVEKGRDESETGAHCRGHNAHSIGICYIGGMTADMSATKDTRTEHQRRALRNLISEIRQRHPLAVPYGHNDFTHKACPCFDVSKEFAYLFQK